MLARFTKTAILLIALSASYYFIQQAKGNIPSWKEAQKFCKFDSAKALDQGKAAKKLKEAKAATFSEKTAQEKTEIFSKLAPAKSDIPSFESVAIYRIKTLQEEIFDQEFTQHMRNEYNGRLSALEAKIDSPYRRPIKEDISAYNQSRSDMARWTMKELVDAKFRDIFKHADKSSSAMQVVTVVRQVTGGADKEAEKKEAEKNLEPAAKIDTDLAKAHSYVPLSERQDNDHVETKFKKSLNLIKGQGVLNFENPIVSTKVNLDVYATDKVKVEMNKEFKKLKMNSSANFGLYEKVLRMRVNKTITDKISLEVNADNYTGKIRPANGEKNVESAKLNYSLSF